LKRRERRIRRSERARGGRIDRERKKEIIERKREIIERNKERNRIGSI
jgi:hypothetical protein